MLYQLSYSIPRRLRYFLIITTLTSYIFSLDILDDIKAWASLFKNMNGIYLDPIGITLKGADLNTLLDRMARFIRAKIADFSIIVFSPQPDFYRF